MTPVSFPQANVTFAKDQPEYRPLPAFYDKDDPRGTVVTCWRMSWRERLRALFGGRIYLSVLTFHSTLQPQLPSLVSPIEHGPA